MAGVAIVLRSPYFLMICVYLFLYTVLNTFLYMEQGRIVSLAKHGNIERTQAFAHIDMWVNTLTATLQIFVASRFIKKMGVGVTLGLLPAVSAIGFAALWFTSGAAERTTGAAAAQALQTALTAVILFQVIRRGLHYALSQPARQVLFTGLGPDEIYKSKPFIDTFVYRSGDLAGAWAPRVIVKAAQRFGMAAGSAVAAVAIPLALISLGVGLVLGRMQRRQVAEKEQVREEELVAARTG